MHFNTLNDICRQIRCLLSCYFASAKLRPEKTDSVMRYSFLPFKIQDFAIFKRNQQDKKQNKVAHISSCKESYLYTIFHFDKFFSH